MHSGVVWKEIRSKVTTNGTRNPDWVQSTMSTLLGEAEGPLWLLFWTEGLPAQVMIQPLLLLHTIALQNLC